MPELSCSLATTTERTQMKVTGTRFEESPVTSEVDGKPCPRHTNGVCKQLDQDHYLIDGKRVDHVPGNYREFAAAVPVYESFPGWTEDISHIGRFVDLPIKAQGYLKAIERLTGVPIVMFSVGPDRLQTVTLKQVFNDLDDEEERHVKSHRR